MSQSTINFEVSQNASKVNDFFTTLQKTLSNTAQSFKNLFSDKAATSGFEALGKSSQDLNSNFNELIKANAKLAGSFGGIGAAAKVAFASLGTLGAAFDAKFIFDATAGAATKLALSFSDLSKAYTLLQTQGFNTQDIETVKLLGEAFKFNTKAAEEFALRATVAFNQYDASLTRINTILKQSRSELSQYGAGIQDLVSKDLKNAVTSTQALAGQYEVLSGGFTSAADSQQVLSAGLKLATIGQSDQGETLRLLVKTMQAYKISSADAAKTAAVLNGVVEAGITTVSELTQGFGQTATVASQAGIKLNELGAAVAALTVKGTSTPAALTGIEALSRIIIDKTPETVKALAELRDETGKPIRFDVSEIKAKGFTKALQDLNKATGGNASTLAAIIPESLAYSTALGLLANNSATLAENTSKLGEVTSKSLNEVFGISLGDKTKEFQQIVNRFGEVLIKFGQAIAPAFEEGINVLEKISEFLISLPDPIKNAAVSFVLLGVGANKTFEAFDALSGAVIKIGGLFLTQRAIGLLLNDTFGQTKDTIIGLIKQNEGLIPVLKQIIGIDQQHLITSKAGVDFTSEQIKASEGLTTAIEKEIAVKRSNVGFKAASSGAEEAAEKLRKAQEDSSALLKYQGDLINRQTLARNILLDSASSYEEKVDATVKLQEIENALNKNAVGLKTAQNIEQKELIKAKEAERLLDVQKNNLTLAKDNAAELIKAKVAAQTLSEQATVTQAAAESARIAVLELENKGDATALELTTARNIAQSTAIAAEEASTAATIKNNEVKALDLTLNRQRLIAQGELARVTLFGNTLYVAQTGIIGTLNKVLFTQLFTKQSLIDLLKIETIQTAFLSARQAGATVIQAVMTAGTAAFGATLTAVAGAARVAWGLILGPVGAIALAIAGVVFAVKTLFDVLAARGEFESIKELNTAIEKSGDTVLSTQKTITTYKNGLLLTAEANDKLRKGIALTTTDLANEGQAFIEQRKVINDQIIATQKLIDKKRENIEANGEQTNTASLKDEVDQLEKVNKLNEDKLKNLDEEKLKNDALQQARNDARKNIDLNSNEIVSKEQVVNASKNANDIKNNLIKSLGEAGKSIENADKDLSTLNADQLSKLDTQIKTIATKTKDGLATTREAATKLGLDVSKFSDNQLNNLKKSLDDKGGFLGAGINDAITKAATETNQDLSKLNLKAKDEVLKNYQDGVGQLNSINKETLDKNLVDYSSASAQFVDLQKKNKATLEEDIGGTAFQTSAKKALRGSLEDYNDYLQQYKADTQGQADATGKLYYLTVDDQKKANELSGKEREDFITKYKKDITLSADQLKKSFFDGKQTQVIEQANAALQAGAIDSQQYADKLSYVRETLGKLATPQQLQDISSGIIDAQKNALGTFNALISQETATLNAQQDSRLSKATEVQQALLQLQKDASDKAVKTKQREVDEYEKTGQSVKQKQAEAELTTLKAQQSGIRIKIDENEIDKRFLAQKEALGRELKLEESKAETIKLVSEQEQKLTKSRLDLSRAQADLDIARISNAAKLSGDSVVQAQSEVQIAERNLKLVDAKNAFEKQSLKTQNLLNELALDRQKTQTQLNKLELESNILKLRARIADKETSATQKEALEQELNLSVKQADLLDTQSKALETASKNQKEVSTNSEKELDIRQKISKEGSVVDLQIAKQRVVIAEIEKYVKILNAQTQAQENLGQIQLNNFDAEQKASEQLNKLLNDRKAIAEEIANLTQGQYSLAAGLAQTEFGRRRIEHEAAVEKKATLIVEQQIEKVLFDLQLKQNAAARERLVLENQLLQLKTKAEALQARADLARLQATKGTTQAEIEASKANVQAKDAAFAGAISAGDLIKVSNKNEKALEEFKKLSFAQKQRADAVGADADLAKTTLTKSDDRKVQREALANARDSKGVLNDVLAKISKDNPTALDVGKSLATANKLAQSQIATALANNPIPANGVNLNGPANNIAPFNGRLNAPTSNAPNNQGLTNSNNSNSSNNADNNNLKNVKIDAPITIEINLSGQEGDAKKVGNKVAEEIATSLRDLFKRAENS